MLNNINKRRIFIAVYCRDELSVGQNRQRLGTSAYHWAILIRPKCPRGSDTHALDIADGETTADLNSDGDWYFRSNEHVNPGNDMHMLGAIMVGKVPHEVLNMQIENLLCYHVPLPMKGAVPDQNCVTWIKAALRALQDEELVEEFDVDEFMTYALRFADRRMAEGGRPEYVNYTNRRM
jgi:uncharacterized protein DUF6914